jgi:hypothetical protein
MYAMTRPDEPQRWRDGTAHGPWLAVYDGHGRTAYADGVITLAPRAARSPDATHAGLVVSMREYEHVDYVLTMRTVKQLRRPDPNPWEAGWAVWHYRDNRHFYYFTLKPNGWELGKVDPAYPGGQRFLATGEEPAGFTQNRRVRVRHIDNRMQVWVDGRPVVTFRDVERPYPRGSVGFYSEDAVVDFFDFEVNTAVD